MTKQDLIKLRDKVAAGAYDATNERAAQFNRFASDFEKALGNSGYVRFAWQAYNKSQDAAVAFLEAALPEWHYGISSISPTDNGKCFCGVSENPFVSREIFEAEADTPARALLLATLDALIEGAE